MCIRDRPIIIPALKTVAGTLHFIRIFSTSNLELRCSDTVSYTHLDVYKRQLLYHWLRVKFGNLPQQFIRNNFIKELKLLNMFPKKLSAKHLWMKKLRNFTAKCRWKSTTSRSKNQINPYRKLIPIWLIHLKNLYSNKLNF